MGNCISSDVQVEVHIICLQLASLNDNPLIVPFNIKPHPDLGEERLDKEASLSGQFFEAKKDIRVLDKS